MHAPLSYSFDAPFPPIPVPGAGAERLSYGPYLSLVPPDVLADTAIMELLSHYNGNGAVGGIRTARAVVGIGSAVEANYNADQLKKHRKKVCGSWHELSECNPSPFLFFPFSLGLSSPFSLPSPLSHRLCFCGSPCPSST